MINEKELRIGNLLQMPFLGNVNIEVIGMALAERNEGLKLFVQGKTKSGDTFFELPDKYKSIVLSTEFLEKTELVKDGILYQKGKFAIKKWVIGGEIEWVIFWGDKAILYEKNYPVHRLQNLYFALSNEELQLSST